MTIRYVELMLFGFDNTSYSVLNNDQIVKVCDATKASKQ